MTQNARVALFVPTDAAADPGEIVEMRSTAAIGAPVATRFFAQAAGASLGEAPTDGKIYGRGNADWLESVGEAPKDGQIWARKSASWQLSPPFPEAPTDGKQYARSNAAWTEVTSLPAVIDGGTF